MIKSSKKFVGVMLILMIVFSYFSPLMAYAESNEPQLEVNSEVENSQEKKVGEEQLVNQEEANEYLDQIQNLINENKIDKGIETKRATIKEKNFSLYILDEDNQLYISEDESDKYINTQIEITQVVNLDSKVFFYFSIEGVQSAWIDSEAVELAEAETINEETEEKIESEIEEDPVLLNEDPETEIVENEAAENEAIESKVGMSDEASMNQYDVSTFSTNAVSALPQIQYRSHVEKEGWLPWVEDRVMSGTMGQGLRMEAFQLNINQGNVGVRYQTLSEGGEWTSWINGGNTGGTTGKGKQLEAVRFELTGQDVSEYDIYYRVHTEKFGWMSWTKNGEKAGTEGYNYRIEAIQVSVLPKGNNSINTSGNAYRYKETPKITYRAHVQTKGWLSWVDDREVSGTNGDGLRMEAFQLKVSKGNLGVRYQTRSANGEWTSWLSEGQVGGTTDQKRQLEGVLFELTGEDAANYDIYYRVHTEKFGWLPWAKNGTKAGTEGYNYRIESMQVTVLPNSNTTITVGESYKIPSDPSIEYQTHVEKIGWQDWMNDGELAGTSGQALRLEAIRLNLSNSNLSGGIEYRTHIQSSGWSNYTSKGSTSGTVGNQKRLEAIEIRLTGEISNQYDVYYRTHIQSEGWLGWVKNGMSSGSAGLAYRLEAIQIKLVPKGQGNPVDSEEGFLRQPLIYLDPGHGGNESGAVSGGIYEKRINLQTAIRIETVLKSMGYRVYMSRSDDSQLTLSHRAQEANKLNADIYVSVHYNAFRGTSQGIETYYYNQNGNTSNPYANDTSRISNSRLLASSIHKSVLSSSGAVNRYVRTANFHVIRETYMPAVLLELGYIDNAAERAKITSASYQQKLAQGVAAGINQHFK